MQMLPPGLMSRLGLTTPYVIDLDASKSPSAKQWQELQAEYPGLHTGTAASGEQVMTEQYQDAAILGAPQSELNQMSQEVQNFSSASPQQQGEMQQSMQDQWQDLVGAAVDALPKGQVLNVKA